MTVSQHSQENADGAFTQQGGADGRQTPTVTALPALCMHAHARFPVIRCSSVCAPPLPQTSCLHFPGKVRNRKELTLLPFKIETIYIDFL